MYVFRVQYKWVQPAGTCYDVPVKQYYNLFQYMRPTEVKVDGKVILTRANACILYAPMQPRWFRFPEDTPMNFTHLLRDVEPLVEEYKIPLGQVFYPDDPGEIAELYRKARREFITDEPYRERILDGYVHELFAKLSRSFYREGTSTPRVKADREKLEQLRWEILSNPERNWPVEEMAKTVSLSSSRLHAVYKELFGITPMVEAINSKIEGAKSLLLMDNDMNLATVAERLGYHSQYHFIRQFKSITGMTPGAYRKKNQ